jgi:hypothetical protein
MDSGAQISTEDFFLLLQGWRESGSHLLLKFRSRSLSLSAACVVLDARDGRVAFWIDKEKTGAAEFIVTNCVFGFRDVAEGDADLPTGGKAESAIEIFRDDFALLIMLLK